MKLFLTYKNAYLRDKQRMNDVPKRTKRKATIDSLLYSTMAVLPLMLLLINLLIFSAVQKIVSYAILGVIVFYIDLKISLFFQAIFYFEKTMDCDKIVMLKWTRIIGYSLLIIGVVVISIIFGGYV
ncbi:hypothetical protein [Paracholeplasma brassicae]|nr:hypothetical protein [Paracholeplasma brassicae]